ncbi:glycoside hydrolase family 61 protein [Phlebiopsis gigantea 11061_1 CR5-6]|uniref:lytic cellulose monooxygenase (C4-dehydrogenating) n=1 Tax=Phlebiopsis gigantea (strain 11061_1 CR5-6) TaxID=745531 RepID=A0A0C3NZK9_PHLG1|nr:glycoside hydrolase family 61 protein [Phlebiopsis gigantea 11061_1 CR5-6]
MIAPLSFLAFASVLYSFLITGVEGHGYIQDVTIGGKTYPGWDPNIDPYAEPIPKRVIRKIPDDGPVLDVTSSDLACNVGGSKGAGLVADAQAGSQVKWVMNRWPDGAQRFMSS